MKKQHGLIGKKNALKSDSEKKLSYIHIRCDRSVKAGAVKTAQKEGKTLSQWITDLIAKNTKY